MTQYTNRVAFIAPVEHSEVCNAVANLLGRSGYNFSVRLSPDGLEPTTHTGGSTVETKDFVRILELASRITPDVEGLTQEDWGVIAEHLVIDSKPSARTNPKAQFDYLSETLGLSIIQNEED